MKEPCQSLTDQLKVNIYLIKAKNNIKHVKHAGRLVGFIVKILYYKGTLGGWWGNHPVVKRV